MRRLVLGIAMAAMLALAGCGQSAPDPISTPAPSPSITDTITIKGTQGLILAELAYNTAANMAFAGVRAGAIKGDAATEVRTLNRTALTALSAAKGAQSAAIQAREVAAAFDAIAGLRALTPSNEQVLP